MNNDSVEPLVLHVLVHRLESGVEAHCLELDHVSDAATREEALNTLVDLVRSQFAIARRAKDLDNLFFPAPPEHWRRLARARFVGSRLVDLSDGEDDHEPPIPAVATGLKLQEFVVDS